MRWLTNHWILFGVVAVLFVSLTIIVAIIPSIDNQRNVTMLPGVKPLTAQERAGERTFIAEGCVACHTQQVRSVAMDRVWGERPGIPADYAQGTRQDVWRNAATLMGTERTGPDLANIGARQPSEAWHLMHLYAPRAAVPASIMPSYPWLFEHKATAAEGDVVVNVPQEHKRASGVVVATQQARDLVSYLLSRIQAPLPDGMARPEYRMGAPAAERQASQTKVDGAALYTTYCEACHQADGKGLPGAFPPLAGSPTVLGNDLDQYVDIVMHGVDRRADFAVMPAVGELNNLTAEQITAIINHERTSWGNAAPEVSVARVREALAKKRSTP